MPSPTRSSALAWLALSVTSVGGVAGCSDDGEAGGDAPPLDADAGAGDAGAHPNPTWGAASHGNDVAADYATVFDAAEVMELRIVIEPDAYAAMQDDMTALIGEPGSGGFGQPGGDGGGFPAPPPELLQACETKAERDACDVPALGITGSCIAPLGPTLLCLPDDLFGGGDGGLAGPPGGATNLLERDPLYFPVTVHFGDRHWEHVGMRYKGNSSLLASWSGGILKLPFRLNFDEYESTFASTRDQRFFGFEKLTFSGGFGDSSFVRDALMADILVDNGIPVARYRFVRVNVDFGEGDVYYGLYTMLEDPSDEMMERVYGAGGGNIYKPNGPGADWTTFSEEGFIKKTNETEADWSDAEAAVAALHADRSDAATWRAGLEAVFDVDAFLKWLAVNTFVGNWDSYGIMPHNYYLFGHPDSGVLQWVPWDHNLSMQRAVFGTLLPLDLSSVGDGWPLIAYLAADPVYFETYRGYLDEASSSLAARDRFAARLGELHARVAPHVADEAAPYTHLTAPDQFDASVAELTQFIEGRHADLTAMGGAP